MWHALQRLQTEWYNLLNEEGVRCPHYVLESLTDVESPYSVLGVSTRG